MTRSLVPRTLAGPAPGGPAAGQGSRPRWVRWPWPRAAAVPAGPAPARPRPARRPVPAAGQQWGVYAEAMPRPCTPRNVDPYLVRHTAAPYYVSERARCATWDLPMGSLTAGPLHVAVSTGRLPAFSLIVPDACNDMH